MSSAGDAHGFSDRVRNVNELLHSMEGDFLRVLAEHHPKGVGEATDHSAASLDGTSSDGNEDEDERACFHLHATAEEVDAWLDAFLRAGMLGDRDALRTVVSLAEIMIRTLAEHGAELGWYGPVEDDEEEL